MVEACSISQDQQKQQQQQQNVPSGSSAPAPPPPRRPRVREVSSRFMSPVVTSSSSGDLHLPSSKCPLPKHTVVSSSTELHPKHHHQSQVQRSKSVVQKREGEQEPLSTADENRIEMARSLDTPLGSHSKLGFSTQRKSQRAVKLFKENNGGLEQQGSDMTQMRTSINGRLPSRTGNFARSRPDTPIVDRMNSSRSVMSAQSSQRGTNIAVGSVATTAAAKLVQSSGMGANPSSQVSCSSSQISTSSIGSSSDSEYDSRFSETLTEASYDSSEAELCNSPRIAVQKSKTRCHPEVRSSMPEADMIPTISNRLQAQRDRGGGGYTVGDSFKVVASTPFHRSLNTPIPNCEQPFSSPTKSVYRSSSVMPRPHPSSVKSGTGNVPPHPSNTTVGIDARKGKKSSSHQEDVHSLRMLHNRYLQWRYANVKSQTTMNAQTVSAERSLYGIVTKISEMRDSVQLKRTELELLKRRGTLSTILDSQMPSLDEWSSLEDDYASSLSGVIKALQDASLRLPISGNVRADVREVNGALNSASNMIENMSSHVESFLPKAEEMDTLVSELAGVVSRERALIEECGDLLSKTHMLQMEECSLRGQLMQLKRNSLDQAKEQGKFLN